MKCKMMLFSAALLLLMLLMAAVATYSFAAEPLTLEQAVTTALANNPALKAADSQIDAADANVLKSASGFLPKVTLSETWSRTDNPLMALGTKLNREIVTSADFNPAVINDPAAISNYNTRLAVMQPVWNGGREYTGRTQAKLAKDASIQDRERTRQETVFNTVKAYYGLLLAREYHRVALQSLETSGANVKLAEARYKAGAVLQSDLLRAKVQLAEVKEMLTKSDNNIRLAAASLNFSMGVPQQTEYEVSGALTLQQQNAEVHALISEAAAKRPDLLSMELNRRNAEKSVSAARADYFPTLNIMGQMDWNSDRIAGDEAKSWAVMAVLQWNLFDGLVTRSKVKEAVATSSRMKSLEEQTRSAVQLQVRQAYYNLSSSLDRIAATASSVQEAEEGLRIVQKRYEAGMTNFVDVLGAESALIRARTNAVQALYDNNIAQAELMLAVGTL
ncbi:MAG TPA: TolC family protein [Nitrospirota bacterium]|nr:TolC family protein [Nitrospirota bacterium]